MKSEERSQAKTNSLRGVLGELIECICRQASSLTPVLYLFTIRCIKLHFPHDFSRSWCNLPHLVFTLRTVNIDFGGQRENLGQCSECQQWWCVDQTFPRCDLSWGHCCPECRAPWSIGFKLDLLVSHSLIILRTPPTTYLKKKKDSQNLFLLPYSRQLCLTQSKR